MWLFRLLPFNRQRQWAKLVGNAICAATVDVRKEGMERGKPNRHLKKGTPPDDSIRY
jgi:hypothetical protein